MDPAEAAQIAQMGLDLLAFKHYYHAATTILFYDYFLTLADEVELIWKQKKSLAVPPEAFNFLDLTLYHRCDHLVVIQVVQTTFVELVAQVVMTLRVYALSQRNKYILGVLSIHVVGQFGLGLYLSAFSDHALELPRILNEVFYSCFIKPDPMTAKLAYIFLLLAFDSITFLITVYYTATQYRFVARHGITRLTKLFKSIVEGGVVYFGILAACHAVLVAGVLTWRQTLKFLPACPTVLFTSILINRMTISVLKADREDFRVSVRQWPPVSNNKTRTPDPHVWSMSGDLPEGIELMNGTYGGVAPTILSSIHIYT
ncbi:hypothetical protein BDM02DRAFT_3182271 [Thelephora ganbajun]|uniref:Uncharacterized protein n=1 Tax=Thelephora ganbajun TaxID=370292 RepID=A0ACB6ZW57_THEGA|nr:hypothetical protein BDM02DRAFT_3182271 [Thelephora ganbajun]